MTEPMASEPAEPTTRQRLIEKAHDVLRTVAYDWSEPTITDRGRIIAALAEAGLLADPAQTTELQQLRAELAATGIVRDLNEAFAVLRDAGIPLNGQSLQERVRALVAEREERQVRIDAANLVVTRAIDNDLPADEALRMIARVLEGKTARALRAVEEADDAAGDLP